MFKIITLYIIFVIVIFVTIIEGGLRLFGIKPGIYATHRLTAYEFDSEFGWVIKKGSTYLRSSPEYLHYNYYNPQGIPTDEKNKLVSLSTDKPKVVFIGDSFVESYYLPYEKSFPYLINETLTGQEVLNLGVSGYSPGQYLLQARKYLPAFKVDKIIIFYHPFNDIRDLFRDSIPGGFKKPVFGNDLRRPINTPLEKVQIAKGWKDYSAAFVVLQPYFYEWFGYSDNAFNWQVDEVRTRYSQREMISGLLYLKAIEKEFGKNTDVITVYIPAEFEYRDVKNLKSNFKNFIDACNEVNIKCKIPDFFQEDIESYEKLYLLKDHHLSEYGSKKMADYLKSIL